MCPYFHKTLISIVTLTLLSGCASSVKTGNLAPVDGLAEKSTTSESAATVPTNQAHKPPLNNSGMPPANKAGERFDAGAMQDISDKALVAWRTATSHDTGGEPSKDAKQRAADEKSSLDQLAELEKNYPSQSTVLLMKGQVYEHFGRHAEAIKCYHDASKRNLVNSMALFKSAEEERKIGQLDEAIADYRKLISAAADFPPAKLGLASCLLQKDPKSAEAAKILEAVLARDPQNTKAQELQASIKH